MNAEGRGTGHKRRRGEEGSIILKISKAFHTVTCSCRLLYIRVYYFVLESSNYFKDVILSNLCTVLYVEASNTFTKIGATILIVFITDSSKIQ